MDLELKDKVALVTGASIGLGRAIAEMLAGEGVKLAITARREALLEEVADGIAASGAERPLIVAGDITDAAMPAHLREAVYERFGRLDILVNNAGGSRPTAPDAGDEEWESAMALNFTAARRATQAFLAGMQAQKFGRIINVTGGVEPASTNAAVPPNGAIHAWAKGMSRDIGRDGITINSIPPGRIHSEQIDVRLYPTKEAQEKFAEAYIPVGYFGEADDLAVMVCFLASPRARYITGQIIQVDGGLHYFSQ